MPQISKIRIVNFQYNDGKRLIADELYDFESESKGPSDVLINLANGGGKSVLVQLMMQPIIPKAKVAGRRIESFFTKATDHCFVAIEWALDGSKVKLMTGIAMAASDSSRDQDQDRGFQIKYYTFISSYQDYRGNYNIISLPLSQKEQGRFVPASFDDIRNIAKRSGGGLERYASDDSARWQEKLSQYGIIQNEWRMIEELNSNEDGLSKYFSNLKTSDAVIDKLIIPRIEEKQNRSVSKDDSSLETMLISYARQFSKQKDIIKERDICTGFFDMLSRTKSEAEELWKSNDALEKCIETLFAYSDALESEINNKQAQADSLADHKKQLNDKIRHIQWEKASADYYTCKEAFERETASLNEAESIKSAAKEKWDEAKKKLLLIECAHYYEQLKKIDNQIAALSTEIQNRENNSESAHQLASLKYSAFVAITNELGHITLEIETLSKEKRDLDSETAKLTEVIDELDKDVDTAKERKDKAEAVLDKQKSDNDELAQELGINAFRMLDGKYQESDLDEWKQDTQKQEQSFTSAVSDTSNRISNLESKRDSLPQEIAEANSRLKDHTVGLETQNQKLTDFRIIKEKVQGVYQKHSLSLDLLFTDHAVNYIQERISTISAEIADEDRRIEATEEAIAAVKRGTLHIPKILSDFIDGTGLHYTSVENYILTQQENGLISVEDCQKLLEQYPFMAYGIIIDSKDVQILYEEAQDKWLPSILPVFTASDIDQMLSGEAAAFSAISAYAKNYFMNHDEYSENLNRTLESQNTRKSLLENNKTGLSEDLSLLNSFAIYDAGWETQILSEIEKLEDSIAEDNDHIVALNHELEELKENISSLRSELTKLNVELNKLQNRLSKFETFVRRLEQEDELDREYETCSRKLRQLTDEHRDKTSKKNELDIKIKDLADRLKELETADQQLRNGLEIVADASDAEVIDSDWAALLAQYRKLLETQSADLKGLSDEKNKLIKDKEERQKEINKRGCDLEEYESLIYSEELENDALSAQKLAEYDYQAADSEYNKRSRSQGKSEASFENAAKGLSEFDGEALPLNEVGKAFDFRISEIRSELAGIDFDIKAIERNLSQLQKTQGKAENVLEQYSRPAKCDRIILEDDYAAQLDTIKSQIREWNRSLSSRKQNVEENLSKMASEFGSESTDVCLAISSMQDLLANDVLRGDKYYTLCEHIDANMHTVKLRISQIDTDLKEFNKTKGDLIRQCVIQGKQMYEGLMQLSSNSKVKVQDRRRQMIKFDIPDTIDETIANAAISAEVEKGAEEIAARLLEDSYAESDIRKTANRIVGSKRLLRKYIGAENIVLKAYKIDRNPDNSGYRTWEQTQVNNSGAEKFVVYFAVILALMAYARDGQGDFDSKNNRSVLILDNPFGPISSKHVLEPMFEISRNYKVQMICLSDISKSDIISCFDLVIRAIVKQFAFGSKEQLTHEGNETIEHGFYRSEQMKLW